MKIRLAHTVMACILATHITSANADSNVKVSLQPNPSQVLSTPNARVGIFVDGVTTTNALTLGGGYTLSCAESSTNAQAQRAHSYSTPEIEPGFTRSFSVPATTPTTYPIDVSRWPAGATRQCIFRYVGLSSDAAVSATGSGAGIRLRAGGRQDQDGYTVFFNMTKGTANPCRVLEPDTTTLSLDGTVENLGHVQTRPLTDITLAEEGRPILRDRVDIQKRDGTQALVVEHQGEHPANHNYAPTPELQFSRQSVALRSEDSHRGWAVLSFGESGYLRDLTVYAADNGGKSKNLKDAITKSVTTEFVDGRRHDHTAYVAYFAYDGGIEITGGFVSTPRCCGRCFAPIGGEYECK